MGKHDHKLLSDVSRGARPSLNIGPFSIYTGQRQYADTDQQTQLEEISNYISNSNVWCWYQQTQGWTTDSVTLPLSGKTVQLNTRKTPFGSTVAVVPALEHEFSEDLIKELKNYARQEKQADVLKIFFDQAEEASLGSKIEAQGFQEAVHPLSRLSRARIDVNQTWEDYQASLKSKTAYELRKASRRGVTVAEYEVTHKNLRVLRKLIKQMRQRSNSGARRLDQLMKIWKMYASNKQLRLFFAEYQGEILAGAAIVTTGETAWYKDGGSLRKHNALNASTLLHGEIIRTLCADPQFTTYDMLGVTDRKRRESGAPSSLKGVTYFKSKFVDSFFDSQGVYEIPLNEKSYSRFKKLEQKFVSIYYRVTGQYWY